ncbi:hypothetical protein M3I54_25870 [Paraburkholderia sp. CNPSo 3274]|uniref:hypothetical protein n=1 Tax=Paraburkholderia sp. CNPSo 3274 TaxID=2940932 RepID=UPI0020B6CF4D|nr:hypothetical protein [Paraburkholderia sp. CNPSo 3274]MCP3710355.1 hypothetical protein [Paraburkholderia sp. CNPSo 3274]
MTNLFNAVHHSAEQGYTPAVADHYFRGRPDYPPEVNAWPRDTLGLGPGRWHR